MHYKLQLFTACEIRFGNSVKLGCPGSPYYILYYDAIWRNSGFIPLGRDRLKFYLRVFFHLIVYIFVKYMHEL